MKKTFISIFLTLLILSLVSAVKAQSTEFTYQGRLLFGDVPANGSYDFEFALFDAAAGGSQLGSTFPLSAVNVNNGVFSVRVDFGNQFPGDSRFLEIHVRQSGGAGYSVLRRDRQFQALLTRSKALQRQIPIMQLTQHSLAVSAQGSLLSRLTRGYRTHVIPGRTAAIMFRIQL